MNEELNEITELMLAQIRDKLNVPGFKIWFGELQLVSLDEEKAVFTTPTDVRRRVLVSKYMDCLKEALFHTIGFEVELEIVCTQNSSDFEDVSTKPFPEPTEDDRRRGNERLREINTFLDGGAASTRSVVAEYTFDNFIEGTSNKFARAACLAVAMEPAPIAVDMNYNPLFIYGESGLGKTHLLYAIVNYIKKNHPSLKIVYKTCEDFINELIGAIQRGETAAFKNKYRSADVLLIDDIQFIAGKESTQEEFFHTFAALYEADKQIILTSDRPPKEIKPLEDRLRTRFEGSMLADVQKPSFELRTAIINQKANQYNLTIDQELVNYMAERLQHDIRQIEGVIKKIKQLVSLTGEVITREKIDEVIAVIDPGNIPTDALVEKIISITAKSYGVSADDVTSRLKTESVANARHVAIYVIRRLTELPYTKIGEIFGRDHSTVMSSINKVEEYIKTKRNFGAEINKIIREIKG